jgi:hypothetical protein
MQKIMTKYEQEILNDMRGLTEKDQAKLARIFHFIKQEMIIGSNDRQQTEEFLSVCGTWEDSRSIEEQIQDIYSARKSTNRTEKIF